MREDASLPLPFLRVDGGMTLNNLAMQASTCNRINSYAEYEYPCHISRLVFL